MNRATEAAVFAFFASFVVQYKRFSCKVLHEAGDNFEHKKQVFEVLWYEGQRQLITIYARSNIRFIPNDAGGVRPQVKARAVQKRKKRSGVVETDPIIPPDDLGGS